MSVIFLIFWVSIGGAPQETQPQPATCEVRGRVIEKDTGEPLARAVVTLRRNTPPREFSARTNSEGDYRIADLPPGEYFGSVTPGDYRATHLLGTLSVDGKGSIVLKEGEIRTGVNAALVRSRAMTVRVTDQEGQPLSRIRISVKSADRSRGVNAWPRNLTDDRGRLRVYGLAPGQFIVCADTFDSVSGGMIGTGSRRERFVRTCYPSAATEAEATPVRLDRTDLDGVEIQMRRSRTFRISGVVLEATGTPASAPRVMLNYYFANGSSGGMVRVEAYGRFSAFNVRPGSYAIEASVGGPERPADRRPLEVGFAPVIVTDADVDDVVVTLAPTVVIAGRVVFEEPEPKPVSNLSVVALHDVDLPNSGGTQSVYLGNEREFLLTSLFGKRRLELNNLPRGRYVKSIRYHGKEIIDTAVEFKDGKDPSALEIIVSSQGATITGRVVDERGARAQGAHVYALPVDPRRRNRRELMNASVSAKGTYALGPQRAGEYLIIALPSGVYLDPGDRTLVSELFANAQRVTLADIGEVTMDLTVAAR
jgi:hypothetical protein